ncbi:hypothetical protein RJ640_023945 [Escallonia rubra]|uniref:Uncharacterized protein n=1 Tax=Escallonia rubra TaxID=112253 RepID=A0AA88SJU6_9ASTE|nr:hypothetical protein RJ640_023945 [Escallonia rubra]
MATFLFLYITVLTVMGASKSPNKCATVYIQGVVWASGGMIFALVYCTAGISGVYMSPFGFWFSVYEHYMIFSSGSTFDPESHGVLVFGLVCLQPSVKCVPILFVMSMMAWSGGHINLAVTFGLLLARKLFLTRAIFYTVMQCLGAICGAGVVKGFQKSQYEIHGGGANFVNHGYNKGDGLGAEIVGTFVLVYTVFSATDAKRNARDSRVPVSILLHN